MEVVCKTIESDGRCECSGQRVSHLQSILAADFLADIAPGSGILPGWIVGPLGKFVSDNGYVCKTSTNGFITTFKICHNICMAWKVRPFSIIV